MILRWLKTVSSIFQNLDFDGTVKIIQFIGRYSWSNSEFVDEFDRKKLDEFADYTLLSHIGRHIA